MDTVAAGGTLLDSSRLNELSDLTARFGRCTSRCYGVAWLPLSLFLALVVFAWTAAIALGAVGLVQHFQYRVLEDRLQRVRSGT